MKFGSDEFERVCSVDAPDDEPSPEVRERLERLREWAPYLRKYNNVALALYSIRMTAYAAVVTVFGVILGDTFSSWPVFVFAAAIVPASIIAYAVCDRRRVLSGKKTSPNGYLTNAFAQSVGWCVLVGVGIEIIDALLADDWTPSSQLHVALSYVATVGAFFYELTKTWKKRPCELVLIRLPRREVLFRMLSDVGYWVIIGLFSVSFFCDVTETTWGWQAICGVVCITLLTDNPSHLADEKQFRGSPGDAAVASVVGMLYGPILLMVVSAKFGEATGGIGRFAVAALGGAMIGFVFGAKSGLPLGESISTTTMLERGIKLAAIVYVVAWFSLTVISPVIVAQIVDVSDEGMAEAGKGLTALVDLVLILGVPVGIIALARHIWRGGDKGMLSAFTRFDFRELLDAQSDRYGWIMTRVGLASD